MIDIDHRHILEGDKHHQTTSDQAQLLITANGEAEAEPAA